MNTQEFTKQIELDYAKFKKKRKRENLIAFFGCGGISTVLIVSAVFLTGGCDISPPIVKDPIGTTQFQCNGSTAVVLVVTNHGHRFAVVCYDGRVGICESTEASKVEP